MQIHPISCGLGYSFLIEYPHGLFLVDCGSPGQQFAILAKMKTIGRTDLKCIWVTHAHYDHYGSAAALRTLIGAPVGVHPADADSLSAGLSPLGTARRHGFILSMIQSALQKIFPLAPTPPDFTLEDGNTLERFGLNASILHCPGHTPGHTCLLLEGGIALAADLIARNPRPRLQDLLAADWPQLPTSLDHLKAARPAWVYTGHSGIALSGEVLQKITPRPQFYT